MMTRTTVTAIAAMIGLLLAAPAGAQSAGNPSPPQNNASAPAAGGNPAEETTTGPGMMGYGMMGSGMMGPGMMGSGMMGPGMMGSGMTGPGMMGAMMAPRHLDGWIAFLKAELEITEAQQKPWDQLAEAMRANAKALASMQDEMVQLGKATSMPQRIAAHEKLLEARLDAMRRWKAAIDPLYAALSPAQKKTADELMPEIMPGMMGGGMMAGRMAAAHGRRMMTHGGMIGHGMMHGLMHGTQQ